MLNAAGLKWFSKSAAICLVEQLYGAWLSQRPFYPASRGWLTDTLTPPAAKVRATIGGQAEGANTFFALDWLTLEENIHGMVSKLFQWVSLAKHQNNENYNPQLWTEVRSICVTGTRRYPVISSLSVFEGYGVITSTHSVGRTHSIVPTQWAPGLCWGQSISEVARRS